MDAPEWFREAVKDTWGEAEWKIWDQRWGPELSKRGVEPHMLDPLWGGENGETIIGISATTPKLGWRHTDVEHDRHGKTAYQYAILGLLRALDDPGGDPEGDKASREAYEAWLRQTGQRPD